MKPFSLVAIALTTTFALSSCGGESGVALGESQEVTVTGADMRAAVVVSSVDTMALDDVEGLEVPGYEGGTAFLVRASIQVVDGDANEVSTSTFNHRHWAADGTHNIEVVDPGFFDKPAVDGCELYGTDTAKAVADGDKVDVCQIFVSSEAGAELESVTFRKSGMQKNPRWTWDVAA